MDFMPIHYTILYTATNRADTLLSLIYIGFVYDLGITRAIFFK